MFVIQVIYWVLFIYGFLSLIQDIATEFTYKKYNKKVRVFICIYDFENEFESFVREIERVKWQFKNIGINVVNMDDGVSEEELNNFFQDKCIRIISKDKFIESIQNI